MVVRVSSSLSIQIFKFKYISHCYRQNDIIEDMQKEYVINLKYEKAWREKDIALDLVRGSPKGLDTRLQKYGEVGKPVNEGTIFYMKLEDNN